MSATNVARAGKRGNIRVGNNVSATMCPRLPGPLLKHGFWDKICARNENGEAKICSFAGNDRCF